MASFSFCAFRPLAFANTAEASLKAFFPPGEDLHRGEEEAASFLFVVAGDLGEYRNALAVSRERDRARDPTTGDDRAIRAVGLLMIDEDECGFVACSPGDEGERSVK